MTITIHTFDSAMLNDCSYDSDARELTVTFKNGKSYTYENVSQEAFDGLATAKSAGQYFGLNIKGQYDLKKEEKK